ncbi:hypothetical protein [Parasphingorhabdus sp.]|uniref:hypothetical protein n=1 Tax=Parasphingorhabdus sp. TaxID=2709688 RepID=UPI002F91DD66
MKKISAAAAMIGLLSATSLQAAETQQCIPPETAESLLTYVLPGALGALRTKCTSSLPANAPLLQTDSPQVQKYEAASAAAWPKAAPAIRILAGQNFPADIELDAFRPLIDAMVPAMLVQELKTEDCPTINKVYSLLEPVPAANLATLTVMLAQLGSNETKENEKDPFNICKAPTESGS